MSIPASSAQHVFPLCFLLYDLDKITAPPVSYGVARQTLKFPGTITLSPDTLRALLIDVGRSLSRHGMRRIVILNGHRDLTHMRSLEEAGSKLIEEGLGRVVCVGFTIDPATTAACCQEGFQGLSRSKRPDREGHGGEKGTVGNGRPLWLSTVSLS